MLPQGNMKLENEHFWRIEMRTALKRDYWSPKFLFVCMISFSFLFFLCMCIQMMTAERT